MDDYSTCLLPTGYTHYVIVVFLSSCGVVWGIASRLACPEARSIALHNQPGSWPIGITWKKGLPFTISTVMTSGKTPANFKPATTLLDVFCLQQ